MEKPVSITEFIQIIKNLPSDDPIKGPHEPYETQKEHWLGWLGEHADSLTVRRTRAIRWNARYAYEKVLFPEMLLYLIRAIPLRPGLVKAAERAYERSYAKVRKVDVIRKIVPWSEIYQAIWGAEKHGHPIESESLTKFDPVKRLKRSNASADVVNLEKPAQDLPANMRNLALSIRQPYAELILRGTKTIEYRPMITHIRGRVYLYASLKPVVHVYEDIGATLGDFPTGVIVGTVEIVACTGYPGHYEWHLAHPERLSQPIKPVRHPQPSWFKPFAEKG